MMMKMIAVAVCMAGMTTTANAQSDDSTTASVMVTTDDSAGDDFLGGLVDGLGAGVDMAACALDCADKFTTADIMQCTMAASTDLAAVTACSADLLACTDACTGGAIGDVVDGVSDAVGEMTAAAAAAAGEIAAAALAELSDLCVDLTKMLSVKKAQEAYQISSCTSRCKASIGHKFTSCAMFSATCLKEMNDFYNSVCHGDECVGDDDDGDDGDDGYDIAAYADLILQEVSFFKKCGDQADLDGFEQCATTNFAEGGQKVAAAAPTDPKSSGRARRQQGSGSKAMTADISSFGEPAIVWGDDDFGFGNNNLVDAADCDDYCKDEDNQDDFGLSAGEDQVDTACSAFDEAVTAAKVACEITGDCTAVNAAVTKGASEQAAADSFAAGSSAKTVQVAASLVGVAVMAWIV